MKVHFAAKTPSVLLCLVVLFISGCAKNIWPERGAVARPEARIAIPEKGVGKGTFKATDNVSIVYSLSGEPFSLAGSVVFDRSLTDSFPIIVRFSLKMSYLDQEGRVLETVDATPVYGALGQAPKSLDIRVNHPVPPGARAIAFSYLGKFRSDTHDMGDGWDLSYFPFH